MASFALALALSLSAPAGAAPPPLGSAANQPYATGVRLIEELFLEPERLDAGTMLRSAARSAVHDLHWLQARYDPDGVDLYHGAGTPIGRVEVHDLDGLPAALARLEELIVGSGYDLGGVDVRLSVLSGMADALDRYSRVLADERLDRFNVRLRGTRVGIGAGLDWVGAGEGAELRVTEVSPGGPADLAGLHEGDVVLRIDGRSTVSMPSAEVGRRVGGEDGTQLTLTVKRGEAAEDVALTRAEVVVPNVGHRVLADGVGYVSIDHVSQRTVENLRAALDALQRRGALDKGLVIDLRGNTGGSMKESAHVADVFLDHGLLLRTVGKDGGRVQNLQAEMYAEADEEAPPVPVVVVVDDRTASGSEILAGALVELDRAALIGTRTFGKGTVQKIYPLQPDIRLKLTVARYLLANDRSISDNGLIPDVVVGRIQFEGGADGADDVRFTGWDERWQQVAWSRIVPEVHTGTGDVDLPVEIARRAVLHTEGTSRDAIVAQLQRQAAEAATEQQARLRVALEAKGLDWSPTERPVAGAAERIAAKVRLDAVRGQGDTWTLRATVANADPNALHQSLVELTCPTAPYWDGVVVPIGRVASGGSASGRVRVALPPGVDPRQDLVKVRLRADGRLPLAVGEQVLEGESTALPALRARAKLAPVPGEVGPHGFPVQQADVTLQNLTKTPIHGLEARFGFPGTDAVELLDHGARLAELGPKRDAHVTMLLEVGPTAPAVLPLSLEVDADRFGPLAGWPLALPVDGQEVVLQPPAIQAEAPSRSAPAGLYTLPVVVTDDRRVDHVVVWVNGEKAAWVPGGSEQVQLAPSFAIVAGDNRIVVQTEDDQHLVAVRVVSVRGEAEPETVDAGM
ncbi:MAG: S41 family peptidase [Myxococcota bacterium]